MKRKLVVILKGIGIAVGALVIVLLVLLAVYAIQINRSNGQLFSAGEQRAYLLHVPQSYRGDVSVPLVVSLHGFAQWSANQMEISRWDKLADEQGFIVVFPSGTGFPLRWRTGGLTDPAPDVQYIADLIDHLSAQYNIDANRIYVNGLSNGGGMSFALSCKLSERIAAFGSVAGAYTLPWQECQPERLMPAMIFHGDADPIVPFNGGNAGPSVAPLPDIRGWVAALAAQRRCSPAPAALPAQGEVRGLRFMGCAQGAEVLFYQIYGGGHTWAGGEPLPEIITGHTTQDIDATRVMWAFFKQHPLNK